MPKNLTYVKQDCETCFNLIEIEFEVNEVFKIIRCKRCHNLSSAWRTITAEDDIIDSDFLRGLVGFWYCEECFENR